MAIKALIIDDSITARITVRGCIPDDSGCEVFEAKNGTEGLKQFKDINPEIIFLDLTMPDMSGFDVLEEIRKTNKQTVVVMITADIQKKTREKALKIGANDILKKPPDASDIQRHIEHLK